MKTKAAAADTRRAMRRVIALEVRGTAPLVQRKALNVDGRVCILPTAIKRAILLATQGLNKTLKKTTLRTQLFVLGQSVPITFTKEGTFHVSYPTWYSRPRFDGWKARLRIEFDDALAARTVVELLCRAGSVGIGAWCPDKGGIYGTFEVVRHIVDTKEIAEVRRECAVAVPIAEFWLAEVEEAAGPAARAKAKAKRPNRHAD